MKTQKIYTGGKFVETKSEITVYCSYDNKPVAKTFLAGKEEIEYAIEQGLKAEIELKNMPVYKRSEILSAIARMLQRNKQGFSETIALEACKPYKYALGETERAITCFQIAAEEVKRLPREYISLDWTAAGENKEGFVKYFPVGLIAGISPFNFPLNLAVHKIAPAIASGNPIILKPSRSTPLSTLLLAEIIDKTDLPKGAVSILPTDRKLGNILVTDERIKKLTFTGSAEVGWQMKSQCGKKKITLELGGNAGVIVSDTADINQAVKKCVTGAFAYSGQVCIHTQRIYVHEKVFDNFTQKFVSITKSLKHGHPLDKKTDISSMIDEENAIRVDNWITEAVNGGAKILCGGKRNNTYFEPTVLTNTKNDMKVCSLEIFGPVAVIEKYSDFSEAINMINDSDFGLQASVFTNSLSEMNKAYNEIETGGVIINDVPTFRVDHMPYGGVKNSGYGREGIKYAIMEMTEPKLLVKPIL
ncbi:MAG: aldehyde dehydrogenase family protein [Marinilabiliales bacterium]